MTEKEIMEWKFSEWYKNDDKASPSYICTYIVPCIFIYLISHESEQCEWMWM